MSWLPTGCEKLEGGAEPWIEFVGSDVEVMQVVGGTRGTDYVYVMFEGLLTNVKYLPGAELVTKECAGRFCREIYRVPKSILTNKLIMIVNFSNSGSMLTLLCMVREEVVDCYWCPHYENICRELALRFRFIGEEAQLAKFYINFIPKLINEIKNIAERSSVRKIFFAAHAWRLREVFNNPQLSLFTSMVLDTWQGRVLSLENKISHIVELWVLAKVIEAVDGETISEVWWVEFRKNYPFAYIRSRTIGREYTIFYQPSVYSDINSLFTPRKERLHLIPDIVMFKGIPPQRLGWNKLYAFIDQGNYPILVIEVKLGIETSEWRKPEYVLRQLEAYKQYLKPKNIALAVLTRLEEPSLKTELEELGVDLYEDLLNPDIQVSFAQYVQNVLK